MRPSVEFSIGTRPKSLCGAIHFLEHGGNTAHGSQFHTLAEAVDRREVTVAVERAEEGDAQFADQGTAAADQFAEHAADRAGR